MTGVRDDGTLDWGASDALNALETVMWRAEADPALSSTVLALEILDRVPEWERCRAAHEWGSLAVTRFRQRVVDGPAGIGQPRWVVDAHFDLDRHVRRVQMPEGTTLRDVLLRARDIAVVPFDRERPPWQAVLLEGAAGRSRRLRPEDAPRDPRRAGEHAAARRPALADPRADPGQADAAAARGR